MDVFFFTNPYKRTGKCSLCRCGASQNMADNTPNQCVFTPLREAKSRGAPLAQRLYELDWY